MVFFVCSGCGTSLKKNQVGSHIYKCRKCEYVSCMDCSKDFWDDEYANHTVCLTENEKYGGANYVGKELSGQKKQLAWAANVRQSIANARNMKPELRSLLEKLLGYENIPRKKSKFKNFLLNNNYRKENMIDMAWDFLETVKKPNNDESQPGTNQPNQQNDNQKDSDSKSVDDMKQLDSEVAVSKEEEKRKSKRERKEERRKKQTKVQKKDKKRKLSDAEENCGNEDVSQDSKRPKKKKQRQETSNQENEEPNTEEESMVVEEREEKRSPFKWKKAIALVLREAPQEGMKMTKLKRKVFSLYMESKEDASHKKSNLEVEALLSKKLQMRNDKYVMVKDRVKLREA